MYQALAAVWVVLGASVAMAANSSGTNADVDPRFQNYAVNVWVKLLDVIKGCFLDQAVVLVKLVAS